MRVQAPYIYLKGLHEPSEAVALQPHARIVGTQATAQLGEYLMCCKLHGRPAVLWMNSEWCGEHKAKLERWLGIYY